MPDDTMTEARLAEIERDNAKWLDGSEKVSALCTALRLAWVERDKATISWQLGAYEVIPEMEFRIAELEAENERLNLDNIGLTKALRAQNTEVAKLVTRKESLFARIADLERENAGLRARVDGEKTAGQV